MYQLLHIINGSTHCLNTIASFREGSHSAQCALLVLINSRTDDFSYFDYALMDGDSSRDDFAFANTMCKTHSCCAVA